MDQVDHAASSAPGTIYRDFLAQRQLAFQRCAQCSAATFPPRLRCAACGRDSLVWQQSKGRGTVYSVSTITPRQGASYCVALVDLADGFRMMTNIVEATGPVAIGDQVEVTFIESADVNLPVFEVVR